MTEIPGTPSAEDLDKVYEENKAKEATAPGKSAHEAAIGDLTKPIETEKPEPEVPSATAPAMPDLTPGPETDEAVAHIESLGYSKEIATGIVRGIGVDRALEMKKAKQIENAQAKGAEVAPQIQQVGPTAGSVIEYDPKAGPPKVNRHGEVFNPEIHAQLPTGDPATDSTGRFQLKTEYYSPKTSAQFPDSGPVK